MPHSDHRGALNIVMYPYRVSRDLERGIAGGCTSEQRYCPNLSAYYMSVIMGCQEGLFAGLWKP